MVPDLPNKYPHQFAASGMQNTTNRVYEPIVGLLSKDRANIMTVSKCSSIYLDHGLVHRFHSADGSVVYLRDQLGNFTWGKFVG